MSGCGGRAPAVHVYLSSLFRALFLLTAPLISSLFSALRSLIALSSSYVCVVYVSILAHLCVCICICICLCI